MPAHGVLAVCVPSHQVAAACEALDELRRVRSGQQPAASGDVPDEPAADDDAWVRA